MITFGELIDKEREFILRSLALCGIRVVVPISNISGRFRLSENELKDQPVQEIHLLDSSYEGIRQKLEEIGFLKKGNIEKFEVYVYPEEVLNDAGFSGTFEVGNLVMVNTTIDENRYSKYIQGCGAIIQAGTRALVVRKDAEIFGLLSETGTIVQLYKPDERKLLNSLVYLKDTFFRYEMNNVNHTEHSFKSGYFKSIFQ
jgi:hypothetical protein